MKKTIWIAGSIAALVMVACGNNDNSSPSSEKDLSSNPVYQEGLTLTIKNNCISCHQVDDKITGPSYRDVANKYGSDGKSVIPALAKKIIDGGSGVWGEIPMKAHPDVSQEDAEKMVKYILLLKK